ncbi:MAG: HigA family addiction module antidote protein [Anaerolineales bacterium]|nr:HigA family addiction module antidote protein [Anaerolineales bacterium]
MTKKIAPVHPGKVLLEEFLMPLGISQNQLAQHLNVNVSRVNDIIRGRWGITALAVILGIQLNPVPVPHRQSPATRSISPAPCWIGLTYMSKSTGRL